MKSLRLIPVVCAAIALTAVSAFSQSTPSDKSAAPQSPAAAAAEAQSRETAIYGEVQSVNAAAGTMSVQYYDYDSDSEKTVEIAVSKDTKMENASSVGGIKKGEWVDVTYTSSEGKNTAKTVSVEKEDVDVQDAAAADTGAAPAETQ
jgi:hypothetical protein